MTDRITRAARASGLLIAPCLLCAGCSLLPSQPGKARHPAPARTAAAHASPGQAPVPPLSTLLPFSPAQLHAAATLAIRFAAAYDTWAWQQPPAAWLATLQPMTTSSLYGQLTQAAAIPGVLSQRNAARQAASATATTPQIRDLTPGSVTITVTVSQVITATSGTTRTAATLAVTLTPQGSGWTVWDVEPATAGNT